MSAAPYASLPGTEVLINKPTIIDGEWRDVPAIVRLQSGRIVAERLPIREQLREAVRCFAVMAVTGVPLFLAADWLRYGGVA